jgi:DNA-binding winged helix-turn-helix (wHTH) protein/predicted ATPase
MAVSSSENGISFGPFFLSAENALLLKDGAPVALTPRAFDVLHYLAARPQKLVTKDELLSKIWTDVLVSDASIKVCILEIRKALGDGAKMPTFIETVHRRGYRFIAPIRGVSERTSSDLEEAPLQQPAVVTEQPPVSQSMQPFVGRDAQLRELREAYQLAASGRRQCVIISGEPGGGKTTLVEEFARSFQGASSTARPVFLYGHCFEQLGAGEPYMPIWEAIGRVARQTHSAQALSLLERHAAAYPSATGQSCASPSERPTTPITPKSDRMLREISEGIESMATNSPLVLVLEDVHWADHSTIDLISALGGRQVPSKLLIVLTHRPGEIAAKTDHPLRAVFGRMLSTGRCREIPLDELDEHAVAEFVSRRCPGGQFSPEFSRRLHQRTSGSPLFLVQLVDDLIDQGILFEKDGVWHLDTGEAARDDRSQRWLSALDTLVPQNLRAMINSHVERLDPDLRRFLEAASVSGVTFSALSVAAAAETDVVRAEEACEELARGHRFLQQTGHDEWPDGSIGTHYAFAHSLFHNVVYEQIPIAKRIRLHQLAGLRIESAWGVRAPEESATLAMHFEAARDWSRAVKYLRQAAQIASGQYAYPEAEYYLRRALACVERLPAAQRDEHELDVLSALSVNLQVTRGFAAPEVEALYARAHALCLKRRDIADVAKTFPVLWGIWLFHKVRSDLIEAVDMGNELMSLARGNTSLQLQAHQAMCVTNLCRGEPQVTCAHMELASAMYDPVLHKANAERFGQDPGVATLAFGSVALWIIGRTQDASQASEQSLTLAIKLAQPSSQALAMHFAAMLHQLRGDVDKTAHWAQHSIDLAEIEGFSFWRAGGQILRGWANALRAAEAENKAEASAAIDDIRRGLDAWLATGSRTYHTYYLGLLADSLQQTGRAVESLEPLTKAISLTKTLGEGLYEAELYRLHGRAIVLSTPDDPCPFDARTSFIQATSVARLQNARSFEDRASTDLAILLGRQMQKTADISTAPFRSASHLQPLNPLRERTEPSDESRIISHT